MLTKSKQKKLNVRSMQVWFLIDYHLFVERPKKFFLEWTIYQYVNPFIPIKIKFKEKKENFEFFRKISVFDSLLSRKKIHVYSKVLDLKKWESVFSLTIICIIINIFNFKKFDWEMLEISISWLMYNGGTLYPFPLSTHINLGVGMEEIHKQ